jgi:hypothetical protein
MTVEIPIILWFHFSGKKLVMFFPNHGKCGVFFSENDGKHHGFYGEATLRPLACLDPGAQRLGS